jgi:hypothetical protein
MFQILFITIQQKGIDNNAALVEINNKQRQYLIARGDFRAIMVDEIVLRVAIGGWVTGVGGVAKVEQVSGVVELDKAVVAVLGLVRVVGWSHARLMMLMLVLVRVTIVRFVVLKISIHLSTVVYFATSMIIRSLLLMGSAYRYRTGYQTVFSTDTELKIAKPLRL